MGKLKMKHLVLFLLLGITIPTFAQQPGNMPQERKRREMPSPETKASSITTEFKKAFRLTDKEYDKIYKLYLKHEKSITPDQMGPGGMPPRGGMGRPSGGPSGFGGGGFGGPDMGGGFPPQGGFGPGPGGNAPEDMKAMMEEMKKNMEKKREKAGQDLEKKMKKILKGEDFTRWQQWESNRKSKEKPFAMPERPFN